VEVTNCFAVPHAERGEEVAIGKDFNKQMLNLHLKSNRKETVVGWYASAAQGDDGDTRLLENSIPVRAYRCTPVTMLGDSVANMFLELNLKLTNSESETICLHQMLADSHLENNKNQNSSKVEPLLVSMEKLYELLEATSDYVDGVVAGTTPPDAEIGRQIADSLDAVPRMSPEGFDTLFNDSLQDLLMVTYLSNITRTQLSIAKKLNASLGA
jgi:translation initiation factor 3 subunit F